jgi:hypothetical protein
MSVGNGGTVIASGTGAATQTATGRINTIFGFAEYTIQVAGLNVFLTPGTYWLSVSPSVGADPTVTSGGVFRSYNSSTTGTNAVGTPPRNDADGLFFSPFLGDNFVTFHLDYSMGVAGTPIQAVPEPSTPIPVGLASALLGLDYCRHRGRAAAAA